MEKSWLMKLQELDPQMKRRVLAVATVVIVGMVIYVWLAYFNNILATTTAQLQADNAAVAAAGAGSTSSTVDVAYLQSSPAVINASEPSAWQSFTGGAAYAYGVFANTINGWMSAIRGPKEYVVQPN